MKQISRITQTFLLILITLAAQQVAFSEELLPRQCSSRFVPQVMRVATEFGGLHITARGTLRVLIVFASFPDDETVHPFWPAHNPPLFMQQFIDQDTTTRSQNDFNLTNYFYQMSAGQFNLIGDAIWLETAHSQQEYLNGSYGRANRDILTERIDSVVDFSAYDHWTKLADFAHAEVPDGRVDMIIMVWRSNLFQFLGEASLGYKPGFTADGKQIEMGFPEFLPFPLGSGVTCQYIYSDTPHRVTQTMIHELGHWLLGGPHPYNNDAPHDKHMYWGMLCNGLRASSCANAYERERLGWIVVPEIPLDVDVSLPDYLGSGTAYKFHPPNGEPVEYFYIENHQKVSILDDVTINPDDKGVWLLHQEGPYMEVDNLKIRPSDGYWRWGNPGTTTDCFSQALPVFNKNIPDLQSGVSHRDQVPTNSSAVNWMYAYQTPAGDTHCGSFYAGEMFSGAFTIGTSSVFSPYSNPGSSTWQNQPTSFCLEIVDESNGVITVRRDSSPLDASPARRYLGADPTSDLFAAGSVSLAWGSQWADGQPLEGDVNWSTLERQIGIEGNWNTVYQGPSMSWSDQSLPYDTSGTIPVFFRVRVLDMEGKYSTWSEVFCAQILTVDGVKNIGEEDWPVQCALDENHPDPFNMSTTIGFRIKDSGFTILKVYDILGREVTTLVNGEVLAGSYEVTFSAEGLSSGVYYYQLSAGEFRATKTLLLLK